MKIRATFVNFKGDDDTIELVHAWDEYSIDNNPVGYDETLAESLASYGEDIQDSVTVAIVVDYAAIHDALHREIEVPGEVQP